MKTEYTAVIKKFRKCKVLVIGDFMLDVYLEGNCTRIAPEASVPVIDVVAKKYCLGGAANVAANLKAMGCKVLFCTVTGDDADASVAKMLMEKTGIPTTHVLQAKERTTIVKTRVMSPSQLLVRYDEGTNEALKAETEAKLIQHLNIAYEACDAVLVADYGKGTLTAAIVSQMEQLKAGKDKFIAVDSKRLDFFYGLKPSLVKPNYEETISLLSLPCQNKNRAEQLGTAGRQLKDKTNAGLAVVTLDSEGALFFEDAQLKQRSFAPQVKAPHVSGAGDTFISACTLALISGCDLPLAAEIATMAAGLVVTKPGTSICYDYEIESGLNAGDKRIRMMSLLKQKCELYKAAGKRLVFTNGCFDILHSGHVNYLQKAKEMGDILIVGLNTDESVKRLKGEGRPVNTLENRIEVLSALGCVDHVVTFGALHQDTPVALIKAVRPDVYVKGGDYKGKYLAEGKLLKRLGCSIEFLPLVFNQSTSKIINRIEQQNHLEIALAN